MPNILFHIRNKIRVEARNEIQLGSNTRVRQCQISMKGSDNTLVIKDDANLKGVIIEIDGNGCKLIVGEKCVIGVGCYLSARENHTTLQIGRACMFSRNVKVMTSDGHDIYAYSERVNPAKDIKIGNDVWLADGVSVLKGVEIGSGSIAGMSSVVTRNIPANSIAAGNPAKIVRQAVTWKRELTY